MLPSFQPALLALADGTIFRGVSIGAAGHTVGEVVFNTAMTGYQEILTDPSYAHQLVTFTYPHIGNTGVNHEDIDAAKYKRLALSFVIFLYCRLISVSISRLLIICASSRWSRLPVLIRVA